MEEKARNPPAADGLAFRTRNRTGPERPSRRCCSRACSSSWAQRGYYDIHLLGSLATTARGTETPSGCLSDFLLNSPPPCLPCPRPQILSDLADQAGADRPLVLPLQRRHACRSTTEVSAPRPQCNLIRKRDCAPSDHDQDEAVRTAQTEYNRHRPVVIVGSSRGWGGSLLGAHLYRGNGRSARRRPPLFTQSSFRVAAWTTAPRRPAAGRRRRPAPRAGTAPGRGAPGPSARRRLGRLRSGRSRRGPPCRNTGAARRRPRSPGLRWKPLRRHGTPFSSVPWLL